MDVKSLKGIAIVSIEQGEKVGTVDNILFNFDDKRVIAFKMIKPGLLRSGGIVLKMEDVESIGRDAVMIRNREKIRELKEERDLQSRPDLSALSALRVVTQDGTYVGNLATAQFEPKTGLLTHLEVTGGGFIDKLRRNKTIAIDEVASIGTDVAVVPNSYAPQGADPEPDNSEDDSEPEPMELPERTGPEQTSKEKRGEILQ
ncbi:MAG: PRC-barrel domain-containing protein [Thermomicrobiaceae bacterium]